MQRYYDEFTKLPIEKMAQRMEDMTYSYNETRVPKKHYKEQLAKTVEELIEGSVEINLIDTYYRTIEQLKKQNPKWLFQALLCFEVGVKPNSISNSEYQALEFTWAKFNSTKKATLVDNSWIDTFNHVKTNGVLYEVKREAD